MWKISRVKGTYENNLSLATSTLQHYIDALSNLTWKEGKMTLCRALQELLPRIQQVYEEREG